MPDFDRLHEHARKLAMLTAPGQQEPGINSWCVFVGENWKAIAEMWSPLKPVPPNPPSSGPSDAPGWTPGPWIAERGNVGNHHPLFVITGEYGSGFRPRCDADAHLIAAAPDLYAALKSYVTLDEALSKALGTDLETESQPYGAAKAALAKARGEKP